MDKDKYLLLSVSSSVPSDSLWPHELQHARLPCPSPSLRPCSNSHPSSWWCHPTIASSVISFFCLQFFPASGSFNKSTLHIRWPKHWSFNFSISHSNEYSGLISLKFDLSDLVIVQETLKSLLQPPQFKRINSSALSLLYGLTFTSIHDY